MKVGVLVSQYPAPSHTFIRREVHALRALGVDVDTFTIRPGTALSADDRAEADRTFTVLPRHPISLAGSLVGGLARRPGRWLQALRAARRHSLPGAAGCVRSLVYLAEGIRLAAELERRGVSRLHGHFANPAAAAGLAACRYLGIEWSVTLHGLSDFRGPMAPLLRLKLEDASFVATVTEWGRSQLMELGGAAFARRIHLVRCGVDVGALPSRRRVEPESGHPLVVLAVGRLSPEKGHVGLVRAFAEVVRGGTSCRLVLIGGGPEEAAIRAEVDRMGLSALVELRGPQPETEVLAAMSSAHVLAMSSLMEGLPVVLMEALALELPVVAPAITGIPELVVDGENGLLYPAGDWSRLAAGLSQLLADPVMRARMGKAGRDRVLREFDSRLTARPLASLLVARSSEESLTSR